MAWINKGEVIQTFPQNVVFLSVSTLIFHKRRDRTLLLQENAGESLF